MTRKEIQKRYREKNKEKIKEQIKVHKEKNKEKIKEKTKEYKEKNKEKIKEKNKIYYIDNKEKINTNNKEYVKNLTEQKKSEINKKRRENYNSEKNRLYYKNNKENLLTKRKIYRKLKRDNDILYKLKENFRRTISTSLSKQKYTKKSRTYLILGCSYEQFKEYIESKFEDWMNWENYGLYNGTENYGWDIDHIIPLSSAKTEEDVIKLNNYINLQPLCSYYNRDIKRGKLIL